MSAMTSCQEYHLRLRNTSMIADRVSPFKTKKRTFDLKRMDEKSQTAQGDEDQARKKETTFLFASRACSSGANSDEPSLWILFNYCNIRVLYERLREPAVLLVNSIIVCCLIALRITSRKRLQRAETSQNDSTRIVDSSVLR